MITTIKNLLKKSSDPFPSNHSKFLSTARESSKVEERGCTTENNEPRFKLHPHLEVREDGDTRVLIDNRSGSITSCNETAWAVLNKLEEGTTREALIDALHLQFQVSREQATEDISGFFKHLNSMGCLQEGE